MLIKAGYDLSYDCPQRVPMVLMLSVHPSGEGRMTGPQRIEFEPEVPVRSYVDLFGNLCHRIVAPAGPFKITTRFDYHDEGLPDPVVPGATQVEIDDLPDEALVFMLASRFCETDLLQDEAWTRFSSVPQGWARVQAVCDFVHAQITFGYEFARPSKTAHDAFQERQGVCRDFAHLAVTLCRCLNIPARYCTGYLGDIRLPPADAPMDFSAWFEVFLAGPDGGQWYTFDARFNTPRIGRLVMARGRDASDVALVTSFGTTRGFTNFEVITYELE